MSHSFFAASRPLVLAHRGGSALGPENTMIAFDQGLALGADGIELDVRLSRDGAVVVFHDDMLERTTNLSGPVAGKTADELARADAGYWFQPSPSVRASALSSAPNPLRASTSVADDALEFPFRKRGHGVPTLAAVLARYQNARIIVELKVNSHEMASAAVDVVRRSNAFDRVCFGAFSTAVLRDARRLEPALATSASREEVRLALYRAWMHWPVMRARYQGYQVPEYAGRTRVVSPAFVDAAHRAGFAVQVWTVDDVMDAERLLGWGVDALITDRPDLLVPLARDRSASALRA